MLLRKDPSEIGALPDGAVTLSVRTEITVNERTNAGNKTPGGLTLGQAFRNRNYWFLAIAWSSYAVCHYLVITHFVPHITDMGISPMRAAGLLSLIGGASALGRLIGGMVSDRKGRRATAITCGTLLFGDMVWLIWSDELLMFYLFAAVYGLAYGGFDVCLASLPGDIFGTRSLGVIMGTLYIGFTIGSASGPLIGGLVFDVTNSYFLAFAIGAGAISSSTLCAGLTISRPMRKTMI